MNAKAKQAVPQPTTLRQQVGQQRTYVYSEAAIAVLEDAKQSGYKLNDFVFEAIVEYGKQKLDSTEGITLRQRVMNLERVVASLGIKQLQGLVRTKEMQGDELQKMIEHVNDYPVSPYAADLRKKCKDYAQEVDIFATKEESLLWWIVFYAAMKKLNIEE